MEPGLSRKFKSSPVQTATTGRANVCSRDSEGQSRWLGYCREGTVVLFAVNIFLVDIILSCWYLQVNYSSLTSALSDHGRHSLVF